MLTLPQWLSLLCGLAMLSALLVMLMIRIGRLDVPVERSSHVMPTPKGGGVGILAAYVAGMIWLWWFHAGGVGFFPVFGALIVLFLGLVSLLDDIYDGPFLAKLLAQLVAATLLVLLGVQAVCIALPGDFPNCMAYRGYLATWLIPAVSLAWLLFVTNAVNFMDGLNGLASGSVAIALVALIVGAAVSPDGPDGPQALPLLAGIVGFLPFNFPRARIFMGDVGSQVCGFAVAAAALLALVRPHISIVVPLALLPQLLDVAFTLVRRAWRGARLTQAHRGHLYQVANRAGWPAWRVTALYWALAAWGGALGMAAGLIGADWGAGALLLAALLAAAPFAVWALYVARLAKRAGLTVW